ncbi:Molybdenum cofactor sulfurase 3 [Pseudolycoriella hygida]|uniref:Molybdenum cofactor sulfurase n=1 Tax=Pseudolycoriella hygida TaxID=35572 RepID=A0A9Q0MIP2_9DIPT|nr:Molybdenum cofactor sulfurase 3 [Pseudolycoriella hygida]
MNFENKFVKEYSDHEANIISEEFNRVKKTKEKINKFNDWLISENVYLDHAGSTLYSEKQISDVFENLSSNLYCNPHTSKSTEDLIDQVRFRILSFFNTTSDEYSVIFTSGATQSLKIVAETFDFRDGCTDENGMFCYLQENHTSVLGMREMVTTENIEVITKSNLMEYAASCHSNDEPTLKQTNSLFVYPAQCNFSGFKYPLDLINKIQRNGMQGVDSSNWYICLDAASFVSTNFLDLQRYNPDFVCLSFYKIFGYPSGLGALIVSKRGEQALKKRYYGGGTVKIAMSEINWHVKRDVIHERFEDGTLPFLSVISLLNGFSTLERLVPSVNAVKTMTRISRHCFNLAKYLFESLKEMKYSNGQAVVKLYHDTEFESMENQGGIVNFNLLHPDGSFIGFAETSAIAAIYDIYLRTGCFCNPGACQRHLNLSNEELKKHYKAGHVCGDANHLIDGVPTGSVRISIGYMTTRTDVDAVIHMINDYLLNTPRKTLEMSQIKNSYKIDPKRNPIKPREVVQTNGLQNPTKSPKVTQKSKQATSTGPVNQIKLKQICVYPIKSCAAFKISTKWKLTKRGLKFDREWMIVRRNGVALTQKSDTKLCLITPSINLDEECLEISFPYMQSVKVPLSYEEGKERTLSTICQSKVCGDRVEGVDCGDEVANWLSDALCTDGLRLIRQSQLDKRKFKNSQSISLSNQDQFLLINTTTVNWLISKVDDWCGQEDSVNHLDDVTDRFRGNLIVEAPDVLEELHWKSLQIGNVVLEAGDSCTRCQMICIDQKTGEKTTEPLRTIAREFQGKLTFGLYLSQTGEDDDTRYIDCDNNVIVEK